jgi:pilus assembly protein CpaF
MFAITIRERSGQVYTFHFDKPEVLIGRIKGNDVILPKQNISKRHAMVRMHGQNFVVEDLGSTNGTYVNGHRISTAVEISTDDKVYLGDFVVNFKDLSHIAGTGDAPVHDEPQVPAEVATVGEDPTVNGRVRDDDVAGTTRAHNVKMDVAAPGKPEPLYDRRQGASAKELFEDQIDLGELEALVTTAKSDFASEARKQLEERGEASDDLLAGLLGGRTERDRGDFAGADDVVSGGESAEAHSLAAAGSGLAATLRGVGEHGSGLSAAPKGAAYPDEQFVEVPAEPAAASGSRRGERMTYAMDGLAEALETRAALDGSGAPGVAPRAVPSKTAALARAGRPLSAPGPAPAPIQVPERSPTAVDHPAQTPADQPHFNALGMLYRAAQRDLRPGVPNDAAQMSDTDWAQMEDRVVAFVDAAAERRELPADGDVARLKRDLIYELAGLGPLEPMLDDPSVEAVEVNGSQQIYVFRGGGREPVPERFSCQQALSASVERLVRATGVALPRAASYADGTLVDGTSVRVVWPPLCPAGPALLLRKPRSDAPGLVQLVERGVVTDSAATVLRHLVARRRSIAVCGWPNVGRRTIVNALGLLLDLGNRVLVIEDGQRLRLPQDHVVRLDSAAQNEGGKAMLTLARRLLPDWMLMGECATIGVADLMDVAADGMPPWIGSFFAKDERDLLRRAAHALMIAHPGLPEDVAMQRVAGVLDIIAVFGTDPQTGKAVLDNVVRVFDEPLDGSYVDRLTPQMFEES